MQCIRASCRPNSTHGRSHREADDLAAGDPMVPNDSVHGGKFVVRESPLRAENGGSLVTLPLPAPEPHHSKSPPADERACLRDDGTDANNLRWHRLPCGSPWCSMATGISPVQFWLACGHLPRHSRHRSRSRICKDCGATARSLLVLRAERRHLRATFHVHWHNSVKHTAHSSEKIKDHRRRLQHKLRAV